MSTPLLNFVAAIGIGVVIGIIGGLALRGRLPKAMWLAPVLATSGSLIASILAVIFGDRSNYGWKESTLQVVLALAGVAVTYYVGSRQGSDERAGAATK